jgi:hypothetical protein
MSRGVLLWVARDWGIGAWPGSSGGWGCGIGQPGPGRSVARAPDVAGETIEKASQPVKFGLGEALSQSAVEADGGITQTEEQGAALLAELHDVDPPVIRIPSSGQQPVLLHRIEVVGESCLPHANRVGQFSLIGAGVDLQVKEHQPRGQGTSGLGQSVVEGTADHSGHSGEMKAYGDVRWTHGHRE